MKKIFTLLVAIGMITLAQAQYGSGKNSRDHRNDQSTLNRAYNLVKPFKLSEVPQFLDTHGWISFRVGKFVEAEKSLKQATDKMPEVAIFHYHLAKVYMAQNNPESAKQALQNAVKYAKNQPFEKLEEATELLKTL